MSRRRAQAHISPSLSTSDLRVKLSRVISCHDLLKVAFNQLQSQIRTGLLEAEDVFESLALPLMKLVGLKTVEMAEEGRFSTIITNNANSNPQDCWRNASMSGTDDQYQRDAKLEEEKYAIKAKIASKEIMQKQQGKLVQLVQILKQIEGQVNSSHDNILETFATQKEEIREFFEKAMKYIYVINQSGQGNDICVLTLKLLKAAYKHVDSALFSVEEGVDIMIQNLAQKMCSPMVNYVHGLKVELTTGTFTHPLLSVIKEMGAEMGTKQLQLAQATIKIKEAEQTKFLLHSNGGKKFSGKKADEKRDEKLLWELLRNKRKRELIESPIGPQDLLGLGINYKKLKHRVMGSRIPLGVSPSITAQPHVLSRSCKLSTP